MSEPSDNPPRRPVVTVEVFQKADGFLGASFIHHTVGEDSGRAEWPLHRDALVLLRGELDRVIAAGPKRCPYGAGA